MEKYKRLTENYKITDTTNEFTDNLIKKSKLFKTQISTKINEIEKYIKENEISNSIIEINYSIISSYITDKVGCSFLCKRKTKIIRT